MPVPIRDVGRKPVLSFTQMSPNRASGSVNLTFVLDFYFKSSDPYVRFGGWSGACIQGVREAGNCPEINRLLTLNADTRGRDIIRLRPIGVHGCVGRD